ncbi:hypothetical protein AB6A40_009664 [Gnathostoma spinigerum]|uniref:Uncharacterized protein n=1 Tax=Gnathostoma spinigerum TaxID=75299 RepID=A0ABD6ESL2_9BILA
MTYLYYLLILLTVTHFSFTQLFNTPLGNNEASAANGFKTVFGDGISTQSGVYTGDEIAKLWLICSGPGCPRG